MSKIEVLLPTAKGKHHNRGRSFRRKSRGPSLKAQIRKMKLPRSIMLLAAMAQDTDKR